MSVPESRPDAENKNAENENTVFIFGVRLQK